MWDAATGRSVHNAEYYAALVGDDALDKVKTILGKDGYSLLIKGEGDAGLEGKEIKRIRQLSSAIESDIHPFTWLYTTAYLCKKGSRYAIGDINDSLSILARKGELLTRLSHSLKEGVVSFRSNAIDDLKDNFRQLNSELNLSLKKAYLFAERALGGAKLSRVAAQRFANMPNAPKSAQKALGAAIKAEEMARKNFDAVVHAFKEGERFVDLTLKEPFDQKVIDQIKSADARLQEALEKAKITAEAFEQSAKDTRDVVRGFKTGEMLGGAILMTEISQETKSTREHPLSPGAVAENALEVGVKLGGGVLDAADKADCVQTLGACYLINPVMDVAVDNVVVPVAENVIAPVVVPVVKTGVAVGNKVGEIAAPVVNRGVDLVNEHVVTPVADKLDRAFKEPARVADQATWSLPRPW